ncbi:MAG: type II toxin-antitoxin system death-on-curing family toxin [Aerococcus sp.]|nr:type II toxin-antitoxin system death-on-curing family toxin [Aerococcus sp.]
MEYLTIEDVLQVHDEVLSISGGASGVRDLGQLDSVLNHIQNDDYYPEFVDKLTHLIYSIIQFHIFIDGNKRTAIMAGLFFLNINYYSYVSDEFIHTMEPIVVEVATRERSKESLKEFMTELIY